MRPVHITDESVFISESATVNTEKLRLGSASVSECHALSSASLGTPPARLREQSIDLEAKCGRRSVGCWPQAAISTSLN